MHVIGHTYLDESGDERILYGDDKVMIGNNYARFEINDEVRCNRLRIDGICSENLDGVSRLLDKMEEIAKERGCQHIDYIDDTPTDDEMSVFSDQGYMGKRIDSTRNIHLFKML